MPDDIPTTKGLFTRVKPPAQAYVSRQEFDMLNQTVLALAARLERLESNGEP